MRAVTDGAGELNIMPQWAHDGQALYFYQMRPTRTFRRVPVSGGATREVAPWSWSRQRRRLWILEGVRLSIQRWSADSCSSRECVISKAGRSPRCRSPCLTCDSRATAVG